MTRRVFRSLVSLSLLAWIAAVYRATHLARPAVAERAAQEIVPVPSSSILPATLDSLYDSITEHNPFRLTRSPSTAQEVSAADTVVASPASPKPPLALSGIVGGPPWFALVDGIPGHTEAVVLAQGDTASGLRLRSLDRGIAVIEGFDTVWTLAVRTAVR